MSQARPVRWILVVAVTALVSAGLATAALGSARWQDVPDPELVRQGEDLYVENCQPCHGAEGKGDGPAARFLDSTPRDLTSGQWVVIEKGTQAEIARVVTEGVDGTEMEPFAELLNEDEIRAIAAYVAAEIVPGATDEGR